MPRNLLRRAKKFISRAFPKGSGLCRASCIGTEAKHEIGFGGMDLPRDFFNRIGQERTKLLDGI